MGPRRAGRVRALAVAAAGLALGCGPRPTEAECATLLDHYTAHLARTEGRKPRDEEIERLQRAAREEARRAGTLDCAARVSRRQLTCAMAAHAVDEIERCLM